MTLTRAVFSAMLVAVGPLWAVASGPIPSSSAKETAGATTTGSAQLNAPALEVPGALKPRVIFTKPKANELVAPADWTGRLVVKFTDNVRARAGDDGSVRSVANQDLRAADDAVRSLGLKFKPAITLPQSTLDEMQAKAFVISSRLQPDLGGMMYVVAQTGANRAAFERAARTLNDLPEVEFVEFELELYTGGGGEEPDCGVAGTGDCFDCNGSLYCENADCCELVCEWDPFCCDEKIVWPARGQPTWDAICVEHAFALCGAFGAPPLSVCVTPGNQSCFEPHPQPGCSPSTCCQTVCGIDPFCCNVAWDFNCVQLAIDQCPEPPAAGLTQSFAGLQGYLTPMGYILQHGILPDGIVAGITMDPCEKDTPLFWGYDGTGMDLDSLWNFAQYLHDQYGVGSENLARGKSIKVGVIEHSAFVDWQNNNNPLTVHEDLRGKVIAELGQTIIVGPGNLDGHHGTACLGIIGAKDDGTKGHSLEALQIGGDEVGCVGVAPEADLYFFPIVSVEEGGRLLNAIASALAIFGPGDVLSFSIGPGAGGTLATALANWTMLRLAADLGVTCCISAGNSCLNLDSIAQAQGQESDVIIVGAVTPGRPFCRLGFSNFCGECETPHRVHISGWGEGVTTLGYGVLHSGGSLMRTYTNSFGGTSAACPQIAGLVANLQGFSKQFYGIPLTPAQIRDNVLVSHGGWPQCAQPVGTDPPAGNQQNPCFLGDFDPDAEANWVADPNPPFGVRTAFPVAIAAAETLISSSFFTPLPSSGSELLDVLIIRGTHIFGNLNSLRNVDGNYFIVKSLFTERRHRPNFPGPPGEVRYYGTGQTTDIMVTAVPNTPSDNMALRHVFNSPGPIGLMFLEMYDWVLNRWMFIGIQSFAAGGGVVDGTFGVPAPDRFINPHNSHMLIRAYGIAPGQTAVGMGASTEDGTFFMQHDLLQLQVGQTLPGIIFEFPL